MPVRSLHQSPLCFRLLLLLSVAMAGCSDPIRVLGDDEEIPVERAVIALNLRFHIMMDITVMHSTGLSMDSWVTPSDVTEIIEEINAIWGQADIQWLVESIIEEDVVKGEAYEESIAFIASTGRDLGGRSDPARLPHLYSLMQPQHRSTAAESGGNLFHIYLFPFIGNTSQGNAMNGFGFHSVVGTWTNKHNGGGVPEKTLLTESHTAIVRGSLSRTISHEVGHVLDLGHDCSNCLMGSSGYLLTGAQVATARAAALARSG